mgnify:CR=1 FL=1
MCPWTSLAGKQTVSELTAGSPRSYIACELMDDRTTVKPSDPSSAVPEGRGVPDGRARGMPILMPLSGRTRSYSGVRNSRRVRSSNRLGTLATASAARLARARTSGSPGSPSTSPREQRLPVT